MVNMDREKKKEEISVMLKSVTQSCKDGVPLKRLQRDFCTLVGETIPYEELGYRSLESMLRDLPHVVKLVHTPSGEIIACAVTDSKTAHIASLIARQKPSKSKSSKRPARRSLTRPVSSSFASFNQSHYTPSASYSRPRYEAAVPPIKPQPVPQTRAKYERYTVPPRFQKKNQLENALPPQKSQPAPRPILETPSIQVVCEVSQPHERIVQFSQRSPVTVKKKTCKELVEEYAQRKNIKPLYETMNLTKKKKNYITKLKLEDETFSSYPDEKNTVEESEEAAAIKAVEKLSLSEDSIQGKCLSGIPFTPAESEKDIQLLMERLVQILIDKPKGVWNKKVQEEFIEKYSEQLPSDWIEIVRSQGLFQIEEVDGFKRCILYYPSSGRDTPSSSSSKLSELELRVDSDDSSLKLRPPPLELPESQDWDIYVRYILCVTDVVVNLVDYSEQYEELQNNMDLYYESHYQQVYEPVKSKIYAVNLEDMWCRGKLQKVEGHKIRVYMVDQGDVILVNLEDIQELEPQFLYLPFQAIHCSLAGLHAFKEYDADQILAENILGKTLVAKVISREDSPIPVILYDTTAKDINININQVILQSLTLTDILAPVIPEMGIIISGFISYATPAGDIYVQIESNALAFVLDEMATINTYCEDYTGELLSVKTGEIYCVKFRDDDRWYRAVVTKQPDPETNSGMVEVTYVDYGNSAVVSMVDICDFEKFSPLMKKVPFQALKCTLHEIPPSSDLQWTDAAVDKLEAIAPQDQSIHLKVVKPATESSPMVVKLFKRVQNDELVSINETLAMEKDLFRPAESKQSSLRSKMSLHNPFLHSKPNTLFIAERNQFSIPDVAQPAENQMAQRKARMDILSVLSPTSPDFGNDVISVADFPPVPPPEIPKTMDKFDVHITLAAHPHNFCCQPWNDGMKLDTLRKEMHNFYSVEENLVEMHECLLKNGQFFAGKHKDDLWYRVYIKNTFGGDPLIVSIYFIDYGDYSMMTLADLQPLWKEFRSLPSQALQASLYGVSPIEKDWTPFQVIQFSKLVVERQFVALIVEKHMDSDLELGIPRLFVKLLDTSDPNQDIEVDKQLVSMGIARFSLDR